jgi:hypothetical protein
MEAVIKTLIEAAAPERSGRKSSVKAARHVTADRLVELAEDRTRLEQAFRRADPPWP